MLLLLLIGCIDCMAQESQPRLIDNKFCLKTTPTAFIDLYGGMSYRIGAEMKVKRNIAFSFEAGGYYELGSIQSKIHPVGLIIRPEVKFYLNKQQLTAGNYVSLELMYKKISFDYSDSFRIAGTPVFEKTYHIFKEVYAASFKYGNLLVGKKHFVTEWYVGLGVRVLEGVNTLTEEERKGLLKGENHGSMIGEGQRAIDMVVPNFLIGLKIGYSFR